MLLAIETATQACSVALFDDGLALVASRHEVVGRGHAERLIPMIAELPDGGRAQRILVDCGPGSFTGVRVGLAAARGLGLGWGARIAGFSSLALIAAANRDAGEAIAVALTGGHGELFVQRFCAATLGPLTALQSLRPEAAAAIVRDEIVFGSGASVLVEARGYGVAMAALPDAADVALLTTELAGLPPRAIYGRAPDARPLAEGAR